MRSSMLHCLLHQNYIKKFKLLNLFVSYTVYIRYLPRDYNMDETLWDSLVSSSKVSVNLADCSSDWMPVRGGWGCKKHGF